MIKTKQIIILIVTLALLLTSCSTTLPQDLSKNEIFSDEESNLDVSKEAVEESDVSSDLSVNETSSDDVSDDDVMSDVSGEMELTETQKNSLAMLNYLTTISQEIDSQNNSRLFLEEVYSLICNNLNKETIDEQTQLRATNLLRFIESYRINAVKRERLQYLYNQDKANVMRKAIPDPLAILSIANADSLGKLLTSLTYTIADSYNNYKTHNNDLDKQYMLSGWELDDHAATVLNNNRIDMFNYMINIIRENDVPGMYALSEDAVKKFSEYKVEDNVYQKIQFFEAKKETYLYFGSYWLDLANCYFDISQYEKCLECIDQYKNLSIRIFNKDIEYADALPNAIVSAQKIFEGDKYISVAEGFVNDIVKNAKEENWSLLYFAAQVYVDLYSKTNEIKYLEYAFKIVLNNINELIKNQKQINDTYLSDLMEQKLPDNINYSSNKEKKEEKKKLDDYNSSLKEKRKTELVSIYEPLVLNCDLLFALAEKIELSEQQKIHINGMLMVNTSTPIFLSKPIEEKYSFNFKTEKPSANLNKNEIIIPANLLVENAKIKVSIVNPNDEPKSYEDFTIKKVVRNGSSISDFEAYYTSDKFKDHKWSLGTKITVTIDNGEAYNPIVMEFEVTEYKDNFIIPDKVVFEQV